MLDYFVEYDAVMVAIIVLSVIVLSAVAALYAAKKYKEKSKSAAGEMQGNAVKDSPSGKPTSLKVFWENHVGTRVQANDVTTEAAHEGSASKITTGQKEEEHGTERNKKRKKRNQKS